MPTEQQDFNQRSEEGTESTPKPDPTDRTTLALDHEITALRTVLDQRISATQDSFDTKIQLGREGGMALKELFIAELNALRESIRALNEAMIAAQSARSELLEEKFEGRDKALVAALAAADKAVEKSNLATEKRFDGVNELLAQQTSAITALIPRAEAEVRITSLAEKVDAMQRIVDKGFTGVDTRQEAGQQNRDASQSRTAVLISSIGLVLTVIFILVSALALYHH